MKLKNKVKPAIPQMEPGTYAGLCVGIYAIGEQETTYNEKTRYVEQIVITFEFPSETIEIDGEEKPRQLSRTFTASTSDKSGLRKLLKTWRGKDFASSDDMSDFELTDMLGASALIQVLQNENGYSNIESVIPIPKGMPDPTTATALMSFDVEEWDDAAFEELPDWVQERIKNSTQYKQAHAPETAVDFPEESQDTQGEKTPSERAAEAVMRKLSEKAAERKTPF